MPATARPAPTSKPPRPAGLGGTGTLIVKSSEKLEVLLDGKLLGTTPLRMEIPVGPHNLEVRTPGAEVGMKRPLNVVEGGEHLLDMD